MQLTRIIANTIATIVITTAASTQTVIMNAPAQRLGSQRSSTTLESVARLLPPPLVALFSVLRDASVVPRRGVESCAEVPGERGEREKCGAAPAGAPLGEAEERMLGLPLPLPRRASETPGAKADAGASAGAATGAGAGAAMGAYTSALLAAAAAGRGAGA
jgi:hypothetical protein